MEAAGPAARRRASHSLETVLDGAVALLDADGEQALTFRALAARIGGGVGSIYWYVAGKDELLDRAADHVLSTLLVDVEARPDGPDPIADLREIAVRLFDTVVDRPWLAAYFMRNTGVQPNALRLFEQLGQQVLRLGLGPRDSFFAVSAVVGFVVGTAADLGQQAPQEVVDGTISAEDYLERYAQQWREADPQQFPFLTHVADVFATHDDAEQFRAGLDLLLAGLREQARREQAGR